MQRFIFNATDESGTDALGAALARVLPDGATVALVGTLGAGKTRLVQAVAEACGVPRREVVSPTFVLVQEHHGRRPIYHIDAYRIADRDEFEALGPEEYFEGQGLTLVEWADRVEACLPPDRVEVHVEVIGEHSRRFEVTAVGKELDEAIGRLSAILGHS